MKVKPAYPAAHVNHMSRGSEAKSFPHKMRIEKHNKLKKLFEKLAFSFFFRRICGAHFSLG